MDASRCRAGRSSRSSSKPKGTTGCATGKRRWRHDQARNSDARSPRQVHREVRIPRRGAARLQEPARPDREIVAQISELKGEPQWMRDYRLKALEIFEK